VADGEVRASLPCAPRFSGSIKSCPREKTNEERRFRFEQDERRESGGRGRGRGGGAGGGGRKRRFALAGCTRECTSECRRGVVRRGVVVASIPESLNALFMALLRLGSTDGFRSLDSPGNGSSLARSCVTTRVATRCLARDERELGNADSIGYDVV